MEEKVKSKPSLDPHGMVILSIGAHPDDSEFRATGTIIKLCRKGAEAYLMSISDGSAGHFFQWIGRRLPQEGQRKQLPQLRLSEDID